jgi:SAM-dependent methyltransferase
MKYKDEKSFWNDGEVVKSFQSQPTSDYWVDYFTKFKNKKRKILDLGCGGGRNTQMLFDLGFDVFACDFYTGMVDATKKRLLELGYRNNSVDKRVINARMDHLPYESESFDFVLSHGVYHNAFSVKEFAETINESSRILKTGGRLCFNLFSSHYLGKDFRKVTGKHNLFVTGENLRMILLSKKEFINISAKYGLFLDGEILEYSSNVSTGKRSVMRGVLKRK